MTNKIRESHSQGTCPVCGEKIYSDEGVAQVKLKGYSDPVYVHEYHCTDDSLDKRYDYCDKFWKTHNTPRGFNPPLCQLKPELKIESKTITFSQLKKLVNEAWKIDYNFDKDEVLKSLKPCRHCHKQPTYEMNSVGAVRIYCHHCLTALQRKFFPTLKIAADFYNNNRSDKEFTFTRYYFPKTTKDVNEATFYSKEDENKRNKERYILDRVEEEYRNGCPGTALSILKDYTDHNVPFFKYDFDRWKKRCLDEFGEEP